MVTGHFHPSGRDSPFSGVDVNFGPFGLAYFNGPEHHIGSQPQGNTGLQRPPALEFVQSAKQGSYLAL